MTTSHCPCLSRTAPSQNSNLPTICTPASWSALFCFYTPSSSLGTARLLLLDLKSAIGIMMTRLILLALLPLAFARILPRSNQTVTPNASCGPANGYSCLGSPWGNCCGFYGWWCVALVTFIYPVSDEQQRLYGHILRLRLPTRLRQLRHEHRLGQDTHRHAIPASNNLPRSRQPEHIQWTADVRAHQVQHERRRSSQSRSHPAIISSY